MSKTRKRIQIILGLIVVIAMVFTNLFAGKVNAEENIAIVEFCDNEEEERNKYWDQYTSVDLSTAITMTLSYTAVYDEIEGGVYGNDGYHEIALFSISEDGQFYYLNPQGVKNGGSRFKTELQKNIKEMVGLNGKNKLLEIKFKEKGAKYWTVGVNSNYRPVIWLGKSVGDKRWEIYPYINIEYSSNDYDEECVYVDDEGNIIDKNRWYSLKNNKMNDKKNDNNESKQSSDKKTNYSNEWINGKWYNADGTQTYKGTLQWKSNSTGWWVEDSKGWYPTSSWQKIDGVWYYFKPDGYMAANEYYNGYWFNADGSWDEQYLLSWKSNSTGWWVEDKSGWWPSSSWLKIDGYWYYFDASGYMVTNQYVDGYWIGADGVCW